MADTAAQPAPQPTPTPSPNEMVGVMQRLLGELNAYCNQAPISIDPAVCQAYLERTWQWTQALSQWQQANAPKDKKAA